MAKAKYNNTIDAGDQINMEEAIAAVIFDADTDRGVSEEQAADLGRNILLMVLTKFRPDMIAKKRKGRK